VDNASASVVLELCGGVPRLGPSRVGFSGFGLPLNLIGVV
jgi:hypothetical protein